MYIQSYQINNILSVYRNQLSQNTNRASQPMVQPQIIENQKQSIMDQVSIEIMARMARGGSERPFEMVLDCARQATLSVEHSPSAQQNLQFTYTLIDENNHKWTNSLPIDKFQPVIGKNNAPDALAPEAGFIIMRGNQPRFTQMWEGGPHDKRNE
jgi:hypothetical protein